MKRFSGPKEETLAWLLEPDNPSVRYFALRELLDRSEDDPDVRDARMSIMRSDPVSTILAAQHFEGYWARSGGGFSPSYTSTLYQILFLAELGAAPDDDRVRRGCEYFLEHAIAASGGVSMSRRPVPSSVVHCMTGDLLYALIHLGYGDDPRTCRILDWQTKAVTGAGNIRFYNSATCAPDFACKNNSGLPCAWGCVKALKGLSTVPQEHRTPGVRQAIERGVELLLSVNPGEGNYPGDIEGCLTWFKLGFPLTYRTDIVECVSLLSDLGHGEDPRLDDAFGVIVEKRDALGRWKLEKSLNGKMWCDIEQRGKPSKWITYRALKALKNARRFWEPLIAKERSGAELP